MCVFELCGANWVFKIVLVWYILFWKQSLLEFLNLDYWPKRKFCKCEVENNLVGGESISMGFYSKIG